MFTHPYMSNDCEFRKKKLLSNEKLLPTVFSLISVLSVSSISHTSCWHLSELGSFSRNEEGLLAALWAFLAAGSCAKGGEMLLLYGLRHLPRYQLLSIVGTFTGCRGNPNSKRRLMPRDPRFYRLHTQLFYTQTHKSCDFSVVFWQTLKQN